MHLFVLFLVDFLLTAIIVANQQIRQRTRFQLGLLQIRQAGFILLNALRNQLHDLRRD